MKTNHCIPSGVGSFKKVTIYPDGRLFIDDKLRGKNAVVFHDEGRIVYMRISSNKYLNGARAELFFKI